MRCGKMAKLFTSLSLCCIELISVVFTRMNNFYFRHFKLHLIFFFLLGLTLQVSILPNVVSDRL